MIAMSQYLQIVHMVTVIIQKNIGIIERNICYIFLESFDIYCSMSNIWACPTTGPTTLDHHQGVKWEDTSKKEEKEDIFLEKEDKKEDIFLEKEDKKRTFFIKLNTKEAKKHEIYM